MRIWQMVVIAAAVAALSGITEYMANISYGEHLNLYDIATLFLAPFAMMMIILLVFAFAMDALFKGWDSRPFSGKIWLSGVLAVITAIAAGIVYQFDGIVLVYASLMTVCFFIFLLILSGVDAIHGRLTQVKTS